MSSAAGSALGESMVACSTVADPCVMRISAARRAKETRDVDEATEAPRSLQIVRILSPPSSNADLRRDYG